MEKKTFFIKGGDELFPISTFSPQNRDDYQMWNLASDVRDKGSEAGAP